MATQVAQGAIVRVRGESQERWQAALQRAFESGLEVFTVAGTGQHVVTSATRLDLVYICDGVQCGCEAARRGDSVCTHRAAVQYVRGQLDPEPEPCGCPRHRDSDGDPTEGDIAVALADADVAYQEYQVMRDAEFDERERQAAWEVDRAGFDAPAATSCPWCAGRGWIADPDGRQAPEPCSCPIAAPVAIEEVAAFAA